MPTNTANIDVAGKLRALVTAALALPMLTSCAHQYVDELAVVAANTRDYGTTTDLSLVDCRASLVADKERTDNVLDASNIRLLNWNIQKMRQQRWMEDFAALAEKTDLVLMQEASLRHDSINDVDSSKHWSFAPGYALRGEITGVMTLSRTKPLTQCSFVILEPLLRTPKATSVTEFALSGTDQTLVVVNIHAVNFSMGTGAYRKQFKQVKDVLEVHDGPIILSGDFNTWRARRVQIVDDIATALGLESVSFKDDRRVTVFGKVLDHIYVRGLSAIESDTEIVESSDHNPLSATFGM
jgi:endonuclease/exonuclease/phosphatase (EEP) superfamily protein YafD